MLSTSTATYSGDTAGLLPDYVLMPSAVTEVLMTRVSEVHAAGLKSFGLLVAPSSATNYPYCATDVVFFDPQRNRRNDPHNRTAFEAQGHYFRSYEDAGFVADPAEVLQVHRGLEDQGLEPVALFHTHRRQPANFSHIDFRLHNPAYSWHLIISLRDPGRPVLRAFMVRKSLDDFGIEPTDSNEHSECDYTGPGVQPLSIRTASRAA